jgi:hypothetical protein
MLTYYCLVIQSLLRSLMEIPILRLMDGKPIVRPRFGLFHGVLDMRPAEWILRGISDPAVCMSYFTVLIKRLHIKEMREYIDRIHGMKMVEVFQMWLGKFADDISSVNVTCAFIWNFHRYEYSWRGYDISLPETRFSVGLRCS